MRTPRHIEGVDHAPRAILVVAMAPLFALALAPGCGPVRTGLATITPTVPRAEACTDGAARCAAGVPESCRTYDGTTRWWPLTPLDRDGGPARCAARCVVDGEPLTAHCAAPSTDAGANP